MIDLSISKINTFYNWYKYLLIHEVNILTLLQYEVFLAVSKEKSFTKAGEVLGYTQSAVSQMISNLEDELNVKLLNRNRNGVSLTSIGERMLKHIKEIVTLKNTMLQEASSYNGLSLGTIRIGVTPSVSTKVLPALVGSFRKEYPQVDLIIFESTYHDINRLIDNNEIDLGFTILDKENPYSQIPVLLDQLKVILPPSHHHKNETSLTVEQIHESCFIMPKGDSDTLVKQVFNRSRLIPNVRYEIQDTSTILSMVREGIALTILPEMALPSNLDDIISIPLFPVETRSIGFLVKDIQSISPGAAEFIVYSKPFYLNLVVIERGGSYMLPPLLSLVT
ncbi:LysR family transcriptional regulator [Bacillus sp. BGMRC 2118]|nr:LysR family transcriptional regulator [Bacillus sp. BGMRC 2118]